MKKIWIRFKFRPSNKQLVMSIEMLAMHNIHISLSALAGSAQLYFVCNEADKEVVLKEMSAYIRLEELIIEQYNG